MAGGRRVKDDNLEGSAFAAHVQEIHKPVKGCHLGRTRAAELLFHDLDDFRREQSTNGSQSAILVLLGGLVGIDLHGPQIDHAFGWAQAKALNGCDFVADRLLEDVGQVRRRVGGDDMGLATLISVVNGGGAGHAGFAHTTLAGEEDELG